MSAAQKVNRFMQDETTVALGLFGKYNLYATGSFLNGVRFVAESEGGCAASWERPPSWPESREEEAAGQAELARELEAVFGSPQPMEPNPVTECKRRWWALQPDNLVKIARRIDEARRSEAARWRRQASTRTREA